MPDGSLPAPSPAAVAAVQAWVRTGGTYVGVRGQGIALAQSAGITTATVAPPADALMPASRSACSSMPPTPSPGASVPSGFAFATGDPVLHAAGGTVVARYPSGSAFFAGGYARSTGPLRGTAAVLDEPVGAGRTILFAFDPAFRGYVEGTERLVANALLAPPTGAPATRARPVRAVRSVAAPFSEEQTPTAPPEVLDDPLGVADRLAVQDQQRHGALTGERLDLRRGRAGATGP